MEKKKQMNELTKERERVRMDVRLVRGKKECKKKGEEKICNHKVAHALSICLFSNKCSHSVSFQTYFYIYEANLLLVAYGKGFAAQIMLLCTSV